MRPGWGSLVLATFAETKVARSPGRNPGDTDNLWGTMVGETSARRSTDQQFFERKKPDGFPIKNVGNDGEGDRFSEIKIENDGMGAGVGMVERKQSLIAGLRVSSSSRYSKCVE
jgi:hypothetical protein